MSVIAIEPAPRRIETNRLVVRCYEEADAPLLVEAVTASLDHLRPWMPWTRFEPQTVEQRVEFIRACRADFASGENFTYGIFDRSEERLLGGTGLHRRGGAHSLEIGYWIRSDALRQGIATEVTAILTRVAFEVCHVVRVDIQIDPDNVRSKGVPEKLGFRHEGTYPGRLDPKVDGGPRRDSMLFSMVREELSVSPCAVVDYVVGSTTTPSASA